MTRAFLSDPVPPSVLTGLVDLASRAPSAGKTQGWHLVVLEGDDTARFWDITLPEPRRATFTWPGLLAAPTIALPLGDPQAYLDRYTEPDKVTTGLGAATDAWPAPYWTIDAAMAVNTLLLAAEDTGLGALFFGVFRGERELRAELGIPDHLGLLGAIALGYPLGDATARSGRQSARPSPASPPRSPDASKPAQIVEGAGRSASRPRRLPDQILHLRRW